MEVRSPAAGTITERFAGEGEEVSVGGDLFVLNAGAVGAPKAAAAAPVVAAPVAAPAAVKAAAPAKPAAPAPAAPAKAAATPAAAKAAPVGGIPGAFISGDRTETRVKMTRMRQRIASRLKESQNTAAMLTTFQEIDMGYLIDLRNKHKDDFEKTHKVKLGFMSAFVKVTETT